MTEQTRLYVHSYDPTMQSTNNLNPIMMQLEDFITSGFTDSERTERQRLLIEGIKTLSAHYKYSTTK